VTSAALGKGTRVLRQGSLPAATDSWISKERTRRESQRPGGDLAARPSRVELGDALLG